MSGITSEWEIFVQKYILEKISKGLKTTRNISITVKELLNFISEEKPITPTKQCEYIFVRKGTKHEKGDRCEKVCDEGFTLCKEHRKRKEGSKKPDTPSPKQIESPGKDSDGASEGSHHSETDD